MEEKERKRAFALCVISGVLLLASLIYSIATKNLTNALLNALFLLSFFIWMRLFRIQDSCIQMQETQIGKLEQLLQERPYTSWQDHEYTPDEICEIAKAYSDRTEEAVVLSIGDKENNQVRSVTQGTGIDVLVCLANLFLKKDTRKLAQFAIGCAEEDEKKQGGV